MADDPVVSTGSSDPAPELDPTRLRPYKIVRHLGDGAFANVYLAENEAVRQQRFAIKVLRPELAADPKERETFLHEAEMLYGIARKQVIFVRHVDSEGIPPWFVMDYADHGSLDKWVERVKQRNT